MKTTLPSRKLEQSLTVVFHFPLENDPLDATKEPGSKVLPSSKISTNVLLIMIFITLMQKDSQNV